MDPVGAILITMATLTSTSVSARTAASALGMKQDEMVTRPGRKSVQRHRAGGRRDQYLGKRKKRCLGRL